MMPEQEAALISAATAARLQAYAPYSRFQVGAALLAEDGRIVTGCNVENASYGHTICAERTAVTTMVACGGRSFNAIVVVTDGAKLSTPCGACRQVMHEFAPNAVVVCVNLRGERKTYTMAELLPHPFGPSDLT